MTRFLKLVAALSVLSLTACVIVPLPRHHHRPYGYQDSAPSYPGGGYDYPRRPRR